MRLSSVMTHGKTAIGKPGRMNTTGSQATGVLVRNPPIRTAFFAAFNRWTDAMSLLRSICCMFGSRCAEEEPKPTATQAPGDVGQKEAERERASEEQLRRMESGASTPRQGPH